MKSNYEILGVPETATIYEIKKAYWKLALKHHPDKNSAESVGRFQEIQAAYSQLTSGEPAAESSTRELEYIFRLEENTENKFTSQEFDLNENEGDKFIPQDKDNIYKYFKEIIKNNKDIFEEIKDFKSSAKCNKKINSFYNDYKTIGNKFKNFNEHFYKPSSYHSDDFAGMSDSEIENKIEQALLHYAGVDHNEFAKHQADLATQKALVWKAEKQGCGDIYLFSTIHLNFDIEDTLGDLIAKLVNEVNVVFTEVEGDLSPHLGSLVLDDYIAVKAAEMCKTLKPLENLKIVEYLFKKSGGDFMELVKNTQPSHDVSKEGYIEQFLTHFCRSNLEERTIAYMPFEITANRNKFWVQESILKVSEEGKNALIACGSGHNLGCYGLPILLAQEGYKLTPIVTKAPTSKRQIVRDMVFTPGLSIFENRQKEKSEPLVLSVRKSPATLCNH